MKPHYQDNHVANYNKDCRNMTELSGNSVQCVVTSPPYWGLRKYSGDQELIWGGDNHCEHEWGKPIIAVNSGGGYAAGKDYGSSTPGGKRDWQLGEVSQGKFCQGCGAWRGSFGLEPTPELYVQHTVEILREIKRVLRKDGVVFWNIGDSYGHGTTATRTPSVNKAIGGWTSTANLITRNGLKPKDLCLIPFRVAIAAQEDGWWVRSDIIWSKPNPMPESVTDRPTNSHEHILMLTKSAKYYWDADAVREPVAPSTIGRGPVDFGGSKGREYQPEKDDPNFRNGSEQWGRTFDYRESCANGRNIRSVWEFPTQPYPEAHFAVFPEKLPETCIKAATPEVGCCSKCGTPWERVVESKKLPRNELPKTDPRYRPNRYIKNKYADELREGFECGMYKETKTLGWKPACKCDAETVPSIVLDPFAGAGTTLWVAKILGRRSIGYELSSEYCDLIVERNRQQVFE